MKLVNTMEQVNQIISIPRHVLSKSTFMKGCQCVKSLWMYKHTPELRDEITEAQQALFTQGTNAGMLARDLYPGGVDATPATTYEYQRSVADTRYYINEGQKVIYEAAFQFDKVLAAIDILVKENGKWCAYEVKSSTSVKEQYIQDAALQYYVITRAGIRLKDFFVVYINNKYVRDGGLKVQELYVKESVLDRVLDLQPDIRKKIAELKKTILSVKVPAFDIGMHCFEPYPCDFKGHCWKHIPEDSVFDLRGQEGKERAFKLYKKGILKLADIPWDFKLNPSQQLQVATHKHRNVVIDKKGIKSFVNELQYPLYFLDFETFNVAIPEYDGCRPYQQLPFQFSLHIQGSKDASLEHHCFLADSGSDPRKEFLASLLEVIGRKGSVVVYNKAFENTRLNELAEAFPQYCILIKNVQSRLIDLMSPFRSKYYYTAAMRGSYSIKDVLPALVPELSYDDIPINDGNMASQAFYQLQFENDPEKMEEIREQLLAYCALDTFAMVMVLEKLKEVK